MKKTFDRYIILSAICCLIATSGCLTQSPDTVIDANTEISDLSWPYINKIKFDFKIDDNAVPYNLYLNLRVNAGYKYSNLFVLVHQTGPGKINHTVRHEIKLANPDGEWLGTGSGNLYNYQVLLQKQFRFTTKGKYHIEIEQNMRDNPLREVSDVGIKVEKGIAEN